MEEGCIIVQTCDKYQQFWKSFFWSMDKYWDFRIPWKIYFCNEEKDVELPNESYRQIKTGKANHADMMKIIMSSLKEYKYIFYMLEDFWPTDKMEERTFMGLFEIFKNNNWDSLKVTVHQPQYYKVENTEFSFNGKKILKYSKDSDWRFNQQASFWKREVVENLITSPDKIHSEEKQKTSLGTEIAMDKRFKDIYPDAEVYLYSYLWYPMSGALWRGELSVIGKQIEYERQIEEFIKIKYP